MWVMHHTPFVDMSCCQVRQWQVPVGDFLTKMVPAQEYGVDVLAKQSDQLFVDVDPGIVESEEKAETPA